MSDQTCVRNFILYEYITRTVAMASGLEEFLFGTCEALNGNNRGISHVILAQVLQSKKIAANDMASAFPFIAAIPFRASLSVKELTLKPLAC